MSSRTRTRAFRPLRNRLKIPTRPPRSHHHEPHTPHFPTTVHRVAPYPSSLLFCLFFSSSQLKILGCFPPPSSALRSRVVSDPRRLFVAPGENEACFVFGGEREEGSRHFLLCQNRLYGTRALVSIETRAESTSPYGRGPLPQSPDFNPPPLPPLPRRLLEQMATRVSESHYNELARRSAPIHPCASF